MKKTVLITGGAGGIGVACARRLAGGYNLIIACNKSRERALELQRELSPLCDCTVACGDITDSAFVRSLFALRADAVINNAGVSSFALAQEVSDGEWQRSFEQASFHQGFRTRNARQNIRGGNPS